MYGKSVNFGLDSTLLIHLFCRKPSFFKLNFAKEWEKCRKSFTLFTVHLRQFSICRAFWNIKCILISSIWFWIVRWMYKKPREIYMMKREYLRENDKNRIHVCLRVFLQFSLFCVCVFLYFMRLLCSAKLIYTHVYRSCWKKAGEQQCHIHFTLYAHA